MLVYQRVNPIQDPIQDPIQPPLNHHFPMVFQWFSYGSHQAIEGGELLLLNVDASSPRIHRGREPPETVTWSRGIFG